MYRQPGNPFLKYSPIAAKNAEGKEQGSDGRACWRGYRFAGTENGKDKCEPMQVADDESPLQRRRKKKSLRV